MAFVRRTTTSCAMARRSVRNLHGGHPGQSAYELAMVAPLLALLLMIAADLGRVFYLSISVNNAASAGVHYAVQEGNAADYTGMQTAACNDFGASASTCANTLSPTATSFCECPNGSSAGTITTCPPANQNPCADIRTYVEVTTTAKFSTFLPYPGIPSVQSVNGYAVMRVQ